MDVQDQIGNYLSAQPEPKRRDMQQLHDLIVAMMPDCRLWFLDGLDESGKTVSNPYINVEITDGNMNFTGDYTDEEYKAIFSEIKNK